MPMLAQPKKKSKITLNPRGTLWSNDENKIGQKLLEKMGWSKGKGLGREEKGITNPIHVSGNSENKGIGFSGKTDLSSQHYENFEDVLSSLNSANNSESSNSESENDSNHLKNVESLEMKSKNSRARVHYSKFTRGKDLSRYSENDLASVLGTKKILERKTKNEMKNINENESIIEDVNEEETSDKNDRFTTYNGNLKDYFNQKMEELKRKRSEGLLGDEETPKRVKKESPPQPETPFPNLEFEPEKSNFSFNISVQESDVKLESSQGTLSNPDAEEMNEEETCDKIVDKKKKRKKSKKSKDSEKVESVSECPEEEYHDEIAEEKNTCETEREEKKTRKKLKSDDTQEIHPSEQESKKKKKKKKKHFKDEECESSYKSLDTQMHSYSDQNVEDEVQSHNCNMNESYVKATSTAGKKKSKKRKEECEETLEEKENVSVSKPFKKIRKLASEIDLPEILKSYPEKIENENNINCELEIQADVEKKTEEEEKANPKVKLKSKKSFKELTTDLETRVKEKFKKISKSELLPIEEETVAEENKRQKSKEKNPKIVDLEVPIGYDNGDYMNSAPSQYKTVQFNIEETFPNSNLEKIKGYFKW